MHMTIHDEFNLISKEERTFWLWDFELKTRGNTSLFERSPFIERYYVRQAEWEYLYISLDVDTPWLVRCFFCGDFMSVADSISAYHYNYESHLHVCQDCLAEYLGEKIVVCEECGEYVYKYGTYEINNENRYVCDRCAGDFCEHNNMERCDVCQNIYNPEDMHETSDNDHVCERCLSEYYFFCNDCERYCLKSESRYIEDISEYVCDDCYRYGDYFCCESCGDYFTTNVYNGDGLCDRCAENSENNDLLESYSYKPKPDFHHIGEKSKLYFGAENEFSFCDYEYRNDALDALSHSNFDDLHYFKEDGSLDYGIEIVSHPFTLGYMLQNRGKFQSFYSSLRDCNPREHDGLHIHISRKNMTEAHENRLAAFIYTYIDDIYCIARRRCNNYCEDLGKPESGRDIISEKDHDSRYVAVNFQNRNTVELRLFKDTTNTQELFAVIEFCHAVYQFTKNVCSITDILQRSKNTFKKFLEYICQDSRYVDLVRIFCKNSIINFEPFNENNELKKVEHITRKIVKNITRKAA